MHRWAPSTFLIRQVRTGHVERVRLRRVVEHLDGERDVDALLGAAGERAEVHLSAEENSRDHSRGARGGCRVTRATPIRTSKLSSNFEVFGCYLGYYLGYYLRTPRS